MLELGLGQGKVNLKHLVMPESWEVLKINKIGGFQINMQPMERVSNN
jgi:hypothetical protein